MFVNIVVVVIRLFIRYSLVTCCVVCAAGWWVCKLASRWLLISDCDYLVGGSWLLCYRCLLVLFSDWLGLGWLLCVV